MIIYRTAELNINISILSPPNLITLLAPKLVCLFDHLDIHWWNSFTALQHGCQNIRYFLVHPTFVIYLWKIENIWWANTRLYDRAIILQIPQIHFINEYAIYLNIDRYKHWLLSIPSYTRLSYHRLSVNVPALGTIKVVCVTIRALLWTNAYFVPGWIFVYDKTITGRKLNLMHPIYPHHIEIALWCSTF